MSHELGRDELRRRRMACEYVEHFESVVDATAGGNLLSEDDLFSVVMSACVEEERAGNAPRRFASQRHSAGGAATRLKDGPTGKATRDFLYVFLRVTAVDAERVKLHQLARVVFVDAATLLRGRVR